MQPTIRFQSKRPAKPVSKPAATHDSYELKALREKAARNAAQFVGKSHITARGKSFRSDCSGTARAIYASAGIQLGIGPNTTNTTDSYSLYAYTRFRGAIYKSHPLPGDLVFFHSTYPIATKKGGNERITHVGVVEKILSNGTVVFVHFLGKSVVRSRMNVAQKNVTIDKKSNQRLNHWIRRQQRSVTKATAGQLFAGYGRIFNAT